MHPFQSLPRFYWFYFSSLFLPSPSLQIHCYFLDSGLDRFCHGPLDSISNSLNSAVSLASFSYPPPYNHSGFSKWKSKYISSLFKSFSGSLMSKYIDLRVSYMTLHSLACPNFIPVSHHLINSCYRTGHFKSQVLICICPLLSSLSWEYLLIFLRLKSLLLYKVFHDHLP